MKKRIASALLVAMLVGCASQSVTSSTSQVVETTETSTTDVTFLTSPSTNWSFGNAEVAQEDLDLILQAGVNTPSAINARPWQFNVITDTDLINELADTEGTKSATVMIIVSVDNSNEMKILDAGLATEAMAVAAQLLGYDTKIETAPARTIRNDETGKYAELLEIGEDKSARAALYIGKAETTEDAVTGSTEQANVEDFVKYYIGE